MAIRDVAGERGVAVEDMALEAGATGRVHELALEPDESARRDALVDVHAAVVVVRHVFQFRLAAAERALHTALVRLVDADGESLDVLVHLAVAGLGEHARFAYGQLVSFAAHVLDENGEVQLAAD